MSPLRHAMRFVYGEECELCLLEELEHMYQPLWCYVQKIQVSLQEIFCDFSCLGGIQRRVQESGSYTKQPEGRNLILHERDERRDDKRRAVSQQSGKRVAQRL